MVSRSTGQVVGDGGLNSLWRKLRTSVQTIDMGEFTESDSQKERKFADFIDFNHFVALASHFW